MNKKPIVIIKDCPNKYAIELHASFDSSSKVLQKEIEKITGVENSMTWGTHKYSQLILIGEIYGDDPEMRRLLKEQVINTVKEFIKS